MQPTSASALTRALKKSCTRKSSDVIDVISVLKMSVISFRSQQMCSSLVHLFLVYHMHPLRKELNQSRSGRDLSHQRLV